MPSLTLRAGSGVYSVKIVDSAKMFDFTIALALAAHDVNRQYYRLTIQRVDQKIPQGAIIMGMLSRIALIPGKSEFCRMIKRMSRTVELGK